MIRPVRMTDTFRLVEILQDAHSRSIYADLCGIDVDLTKSLVTNTIMASFGGETYGAVSEANGQVEGFLLGIEQPVYLIGTKMMATDLFWVATSKVDPREPKALMVGMIEWAKSRPDVIEIRCGTTPVIQEPVKAGRMLKRLGFAPYGEFLRMEITR